MNPAIHSDNLQKWLIFFEESRHICIEAFRILMHLKRVSSLNLPEWFEISNYYKYCMQSFAVNMTLFIPCFLTRRGTVFHLILHSMEWITICWKRFLFRRRPFLKNKMAQFNIVCFGMSFTRVFSLMWCHLLISNHWIVYRNVWIFKRITFIYSFFYYKKNTIKIQSLFSNAKMGPT